MTEEVKTKKPAKKKVKPIQTKVAGAKEKKEKPARKSKKPKSSAVQDNQVLFSRPSSTPSKAAGEEGGLDQPAVHEDSAPSGLEHDPRVYICMNWAINRY